MIRKLKGALFFILFSCLSYAQTDDKADPDTDSTLASNKEFLVNPTISLGVGMFSFYGDLYDKHFQAPMVSRMAYDLSFSQRLSDYLQFNFYVLFGKLGANERYALNNRSLNFESQIRAGGINLEYNFDHFLPKKRTASPYISLGIESFEFLSKTDLKDKNGNKYFYWADGSIRNKDETDANAGAAVVINRDFKYESDIRELNLDGFGKYPERSFAIPVGLGVIFKINDFFDFKMGTAMHFSFTDYIDGVTAKSTGYRRGNSSNDKFMMTSVAVRYNFGVAKSKKKIKAIKNQENYKNVDFSSIDSDDEDKDGVGDFADLCPGTPAGVKVDAGGCPLDADADGVPDYKDDEKKSAKGAVVNLRGVTINDSLIAYQYNFYNDETGAFATIENRDNEVININQKEYTVELGTFKKGLPPNLMTKFLSISDISSTNTHDSTTVYTAGRFDNYQDAEKRRQQLLGEGLADIKVVYKQYGKYHDTPVLASNISTTATATAATNTNTANPVKNNTTTNSNPNASGIVLRVQLGAYKKRLSKTVFKNVKDLIEIKTDDGVYKYMTGSFSTMDAAAKHKADMLLNGYPDAFIAAYKDGKRISLQDGGATFAANETVVEKPDNTAFSGVNKKLVKFKIQLGVYKNYPPDHKLALFSKLKNISGEKTKNGLTRYVVGSFNDYTEAEAFKNDIKKTYGLADIFIVAVFNGEYISIQEALELLK